MVGKITSTRDKTKQEINLKDLLGRSPTSEEKKAFVQKAIDLMIERSQSGRDREGRSFFPYSEKYADRKGVSPNDVDMTLFGDMLLSINSESTRDKVTIKIDDSDEAIKAYAHMKGFPGHKTIKNGPVREFFGITDDEARKLIKDLPTEGRPAQTEEEIIRDFIKNLDIEIEDLV